MINLQKISRLWRHVCVPGLNGGLIADISSPDYETRMAILRKKEELDGYQVNDEVIKYIATNIKSNIRELEGALNKLMACSRLEKKEITN